MNTREMAEVGGERDDRKKPIEVPQTMFESWLRENATKERDGTSGVRNPDGAER